MERRMSGMNKPVAAEVLLTTDDIRQWQADLAEAERRVIELRRKLDGAALIFGANLQIETSSTPNDEEGTLGDAALRVLAGFNRAVSNSDVQTELRKTPRFQEMLDKNKGAYYYTVIARLVKGGKIKKWGKKIRAVAQKDEAPSQGNQESAPKATVER
jgi:hypothetical protein